MRDRPDTPVRDAAAHFEQLHAASTDPWGTTTRWYEQRKIAVALAMLPHQRYRSAFEPGCSIGALTEPLAGRCEQLLSSDGSASAVATCRARLAQSPNGEGVVVEVGEVPDDWPNEQFDLVVFSELGYYLTATALDETLCRAVRSMELDATLLAVHWRQRADDFVLDGGDEVHRHIAATPGLTMTARYVDDGFRAETFVRTR